MYDTFILIFRGTKNLLMPFLPLLLSRFTRTVLSGDVTVYCAMQVQAQRIKINKETNFLMIQMFYLVGKC